MTVKLDQIFGENNFQNEIVWKRRTGSSSAVHQSNKFGACTDIIFFYVKSSEAVFHRSRWRRWMERNGFVFAAAPPGRS